MAHGVALVRSEGRKRYKMYEGDARLPSSKQYQKLFFCDENMIAAQLHRKMAFFYFGRRFERKEEH